ncbi:DUF7288 family protein [Methanolobus profundi]|uniref:Uncharacterized protein n=1 Tax=Methanolobus profundi TaxID=487685 RepID=A0A1I4SRQ8_9EURY|nr:hypothetical protein [Methanolobus profundi]SFM67091.1 hypothetical protein SAMN04488696_1977 [Methanolobus profundi]
MNEKGQLHTLEGLAAALMITMTVLVISQSTMMVTPQNELAVNVHLEQLSSDALAVIDTADSGSVEHDLTECVSSWNMMEATYPASSLCDLDDELSYLLPGVLYNIELAYFKDQNLNVKKVIINGPPGENSVVVRRFVTITNETVNDAGGGWNLKEDELRVVEVRMTTWKV